MGSSELASNNPDVISRVRNVLVKAYRKHAKVPKIIVIVIENDLIKNIDHEGYGVGFFYEDQINWLFDEFNDVTEEFKKLLPARATKNRQNWPHFLWMSPTLHDNYMEIENEKRKKFTKCLEKQARNHKNISTLRIKDAWLKNDNSLFTQRDKRFTPSGWNVLWLAVDSAIQHFDTKIVPNIEESLTARRFVVNNTEQRDKKGRADERRYNWTSYRRHHGQPERRFRLPTPPKANKTKI